MRKPVLNYFEHWSIAIKELNPPLSFEVEPFKDIGFQRSGERRKTNNAPSKGRSIETMELFGRSELDFLLSTLCTIERSMHLRPVINGKAEQNEYKLYKILNQKTISFSLTNTLLDCSNIHA
jgi:hypothetical protein